MTSLRLPAFLRSFRSPVAAAVAVAALLGPAVGRAQSAGWKGQFRLGFVSTYGNSETETVSARVKAKRESQAGLFSFDVGGLRTHTTSFLRFAERTDDGELALVEVPSTSLSAEKFWAKSHLQREFGPWRTFWFARVEWDRNEPAGIRNRYSGIAGLGNHWVQREEMRFWSEYGWTFNRERRKVAGLDRATNYPGLRLQWEYWWRFTENAEYRNDLQVNQNLDESADLRAEMEQALEVDISERFSILVEIFFFYDHDPPFESVPIRENGQNTIERLQVPLKTLDTHLSTSLVYKF